MSARTAISSLACVACLSQATGCIATMEGDWDGDVSCAGAGSVDLSMEVGARDGRDYDATAYVTNLKIEEVKTNIIMELGLWQAKSIGSQVVEIDSANCTLVDAEQNTSPVFCDGFDALGWDGQDELSADVTNFLGTGLECELLLTR